MLLRDTGQEPGHVDEGDERDVERVAGPDEARRLDRGVDVERAGEHRGLLRHDPDGPAAEPREARRGCSPPTPAGSRGSRRRRRCGAGHRACRRASRARRGSTSSSSASMRSRGSRVVARGRVGEVVLRQVREQSPDGLHRVGLVVGREMRHAAAPGVDARAAERLRIDLLVGHRLHDVRPGDEHVARPLDHDREVRHGRRVHRAAGARSEDHRDLRHDARRQDVAQEDLRVAAQRRDAFLDPRSAGIVEADDRRADLHRQVHDLADLLGVRLRERAAEDREVLAEDEDQPPVDGPVAGDDAIAEEAVPIARRTPCARWVTNASSSTKDPASSRRSRRSRAVSLPAACWRSTRTGSPALESLGSQFARGARSAPRWSTRTGTPLA